VSPEPLAALRAVVVCGALLSLPWLLRCIAARAPALRLRLPSVGAGGRTLRLTETVFLPERVSLHVVEAAGRRLLVGRSHATLTVLCDLDRSDGRPG
jgi:hypothetical protein